MQMWCRDNWFVIDFIYMLRYIRDRMLVCYICNINNRVYLYVQNLQGLYVEDVLIVVVRFG